MNVIKPEYQEIDFWGFDDDIPQSSPNTSEKKEKKNSGNFFNQDKKEIPDKKEKE